MLQFNKLRLVGFKSFVDNTELLVELGLTGVVGPNGCGKSNLVEGLRWAMGETSAKQMRGKEMDDVIFEEFKGTGNLEIVLDRRLVDKRVYPAIDINRSGTRREEILLSDDEYRRTSVLRRVFSEMNAPDAMELLVNRLTKTSSNHEFLQSLKS